MMLFNMYGRRTARIKTYTESQEQCKNCKSFDLDIKVYRDYDHFAMIPLIPVSDKTAKIYCNHCGEGLRTEKVRRHYEKITRTPFWLYTGPILIALIIAFVVFVNLFEQRQKAAYVNNPKVGDVYKIHQEQQTLWVYSFLRIDKINGDSIFFLQNNLAYLFEPSAFTDSDFFRKDDYAVYTRSDLKLMLDTGTIRTVTRGYDEKDAFQRTR